MEEGIRAYMRNVIGQQEYGKSNRSRVFQTIYAAKTISKQEIADKLQLSMPTVTQYLRELYAAGIIYKNGYYQSTGGRKAQAISVAALSVVAIGVELLRESIKISAVDLCGNVIREEFYIVPFSNNEAYYKHFGELVNAFADKLDTPEAHLLGVAIAVQGLVSKDGTVIVNGDILGYTGTTIDVFQRHINLPCHMFHDTEVAAFAELWDLPEIKDAVYIALNRNWGGAVIVNGQMFHGREFNGCIIEHMRLVPNGTKCYCGRRGCFEAYCSVASLEAETGMDTATFFKRLKDGDARCEGIFDQYLSYLALAINNIRMLIDCDFILGGFLDPYLTDQHIEMLAEKVRKESSFESTGFSFRRSRHGASAASRGAALLEIDAFIASV